MGGNVAGIEITHDDSLGMAVDQDEVEHLSTRIHFHPALVDFLFKRLIATDQQLLTSLATGIECAGNLGTPKGTVVEQTTIFTSEWYALGNALVDDRGRNFGETMDVAFTRAEITTLDGIVKEAVD